MIYPIIDEGWPSYSGTSVSTVGVSNIESWHLGGDTSIFATLLVGAF